MNIMFIGDIVGSPGRQAVSALVGQFKKKKKIDFVIANAENAAGGSGITPDVADELFGAGVDVLTSGDHVWKKKEIIDLLSRENRVLRPANYPKGDPGSGAVVVKTQDGLKIGVINLLGRVFLSTLECPFKTAQELIDDLKGKTSIIIVDFHAEATSEKIALGRFLDGSVSAVIGTHTHVQTADEQILSNGTAYITDAGMTGPFDSIIGRKADQILARFLTQMPTRFEMATDDIRLQGVVLDIDEKTGRALSIKRVHEKLD
jgi:metallophosphoesterase (TIGR00282 family)